LEGILDVQEDELLFSSSMLVISDSGDGLLLSSVSTGATQGLSLKCLSIIYQIYQTNINISL